eukprot:CAMPEP_0197316344 /NCGR_PEP_ID=MMETSP0891-20130614/42349_1 /TAXON_ID=44058 ORGANISM="Aureoumbra lagunensis, Strain CCMP1510" /NCGR_SAMPLE_ID=MMETSP0891 /ASSEMBLY_ACC=CAM_ASM_000534 /LENGTH=255 /DNA_ID=CAMNT_0042805769 /DNA_START=293 /DNA_END=1060 /DNA_ORIENTATION=+
MAQDATAVLREIRCSELFQSNGYEKIDVVGFSMGGLIAQSLAISETQKYIRKLALASTTPGGPETTGLFSEDFFHLLDDYNNDSPANNRRHAAAFFVHGLPHFWVTNNVKQLQRAVNTFISAKRPHHGILGQKHALTHFNISKKKLTQIQLPTLILHGDSDPVLHPQCASLLLHHIPTASILLFAGTGHHAYIQEPLEWINAITSFLDNDVNDVNDEEGDGVAVGGGGGKFLRRHRSLLHFDQPPREDNSCTDET